MGKFCLFSDSARKAPCFSIGLMKYSYLDDFLANKPKGSETRYSVPVKILCLNAKEHSFSIDNSHCINCMFCIFGCPANRVLVNNALHPIDMCVDATHTEIAELRNHILPRLFNGSFLELMRVNFSQLRVKYKSFEEFTAVDETTNIAVWGANAMKYLSSSLEPRVALEVGVNIANRDRNGRLDISLLNTRDNYLFIAETKVSFEKMISEGRYESQMIAYESELKMTCPENVKCTKFLMIGGDETPLLPHCHPKCSSGSRAIDFYNTLRKNALFFISANAMLALGLMKLFVSYENYNLENLYEIIRSDKYSGLLSCGAVSQEGDIVPLAELLDN